MMYRLQLNEDHTMYNVVSGLGEVLSTYKYKSQAIDHINALNNNEEFDPNGKDYKLLAKNNL